MVHRPCLRGWTTLRESLPPPLDMNATITFEHILNSNDIFDALWTLRVLNNNNPQAKAFALECLYEVEKQTTVSPETLHYSEAYAKRNSERIIAGRIEVREYMQIALEIENINTVIALFRKHFCTPGVIYGPTYPAE